MEWTDGTFAPPIEVLTAPTDVNRAPSSDLGVRTCSGFEGPPVGRVLPYPIQGAWASGERRQFREAEHDERGNTNTASNLARWASGPSGADGRLCFLHPWHVSSISLPRNADSWMVLGLLDLHEASGKEEYLMLGIRLQEMQDNLFWDVGPGGYFTSAKDPHILLRSKDAQVNLRFTTHSLTISTCN